MYLKERLVEVGFEELLDPEGDVSLGFDPVGPPETQTVPEWSHQSIVRRIRREASLEARPEPPIAIIQLQAARGDVEICYTISTPEELDDAIDHLSAVPADLPRLGPNP